MLRRLTIEGFDIGIKTPRVDCREGAGPAEQPLSGHAHAGVRLGGQSAADFLH
ncbi:MAG: hypothetical protein JXR37_28475 [Kiritimatiellae bacterium]|nr:hypothetical protein [Kiritimatiellia bacterium]